MGSGDAEDDRTFKVNFTAEGFAKLRERVMDKLKEFMGDYTDDTLVEYVIVLLKNGRRKEEARTELNVFLGEDSDSFVAWLWDHLGSNINLYVQQMDPDTGGGTKAKPPSAEQAAKKDMHHLDSDADKVKLNTSRSRHRREWKGLVKDEHPTLRSSLADSNRTEEEAHRKVDHAKRSLSPQPELPRKRSRPEERPENKRESVPRPAIAASRRLLQFAVRDAVATSRPSNSAIDSSLSLKRIRSVVSTSVEDSSLQERTQRMRSVARVPNAMATAIRAVAEAAKDVAKVRSANVFDRLGRSTDMLDPSIPLEDPRLAVSEDVEDGSFANASEGYSTYLHRTEYRGKHIGKSMVHDDAVMVYDSASDDEAEHRISAVNRGASRAGIPVKNLGESPLVVAHAVANNANDILHKSHRDQDQPTFAPGAPHNPMTVSLNVNTWKSPQYQGARQVSEIENQTQSSDGLTNTVDILLTKESTDPIAVTNGNVKPYADTQKESLKIVSKKREESLKMASNTQGLYSTGPPTEDADSRTIFVNNVHFAATKDSLSRHFNKFGEVLKVLILTDAATGQPKGSAYVEFMRKESAENALSLDGTSFMSRILKVVRKSAATPEATSVTVWPRVARGGPFSVSRFGRVPFPRGNPTLYRSRLPIRPGARSMQWKRDAQPSSTENTGMVTPSSNAVSSPTPRSMTYVRTESKTNGDSSAA